MASEKKKRKSWGKDRKGKDAFLGDRRGYLKSQGYYNSSKRQQIKSNTRKEIESEKELKHLESFNSFNYEK